ncbi:hypothetical protein [Acinetobacter baumannii]|uniref:hypothetical protein n=1 Tax=Acinetobacter baumannii TaxID=470 RepID=UPI0019014332|nr:hypothetical protein [Acinetobacter baumannii]MBJ9481185.1 hypothetical protein [Acinetobacter baumannii]MBJ9910061.1 hypothetical protein [Acinetobacter baumannii]MBJ9944548.1 hypothetical protein [Acinetobacter baumannii]
MKPEQFIREFGVEKAREVVAASANALVQCFDGTTFHVNDLKHLVESVDRVNEHGGYLAAKELLSFLIVHQGAFGKSAVSDESINSLKAAIKDHESIYGGGDE